MNKELKIEIKTYNYGTGYHRSVKNITEAQLEKFRPLIKAILNKTGEGYNWWGIWPETWTGEKFITDTWKVNYDFEKNFGTKINVDIIEEFYKKLTPYGCDAIESIKVYKTEEVEF